LTSEIRGLRPDELQAHNELVFISYSHGRGLDPDSALDRMLSQPDWWIKGVRRSSTYQPEQTRVMVIDGRLVCSVTCHPRPSYIAGRIVSAVCVGSVCTHPSYRRQGLLRQVLKEAADWMKSQGVLWSFLYGNEAVYGGSGWKHLTSWSLSVDMPLREGFGTRITARPASAEADAATLMSIYEQFNGTLTGPTARDESYWRSRVLRPGEDHGYALLEREGTPVGYSVGADATIAELGWSSCAHDVLAFLLRQWPCQRVSIPLCNRAILEVLRAISAIPGQREHHERPAGVTLHDTSRGLWQYHQDPEGLLPEFADTEGLLQFLREHDYVMWSVDRT
jgi:GNAT superfamily N-acetyltransferase